MDVRGLPLLRPAHPFARLLQLGLGLGPGGLELPGQEVVHVGALGQLLLGQPDLLLLLGNVVVQPLGVEARAQNPAHSGLISGTPIGNSPSWNQRPPKVAMKSPAGSTPFAWVKVATWKLVSV